ncbi:hypothetical protein J4434_06670 [Candidatus Woesearchaeota archaeon]|nr:hypothetical protein [Candidatus Woesearchaeota archaeon]
MNQKEIRAELEGMRINAFNNNKLIPSNKIDLGSSRLNLLYQELHQLVLFGFGNASIVMCGVFLEALLKEILFIKGHYDYKRKMDFYLAIKECKQYLLKKQYDDLHYIRTIIRNPYQHHNLKQLFGEINFKGVKVNKLGVSPVKDISSNELRPLETIAKLRCDAETFIPLFRYCHYTAKKHSKRYLINKK